MRKQSAKGAVRDALREDRLARKDAGVPLAKTVDSFVNLSHRLGVGADNAMSRGTYGFNPITRNRVLLEWVHRGSWLGGMAIDLVADDMTRKGIEFTSTMRPQDEQRLTASAKKMGVWRALNETVQWGRLYGGVICVALIDGQDPRTPLDPETIGKGQFKGLLVLDRWQVDPSLEDLVTEYGPQLGMPKYYRVNASAVALHGAVIHYSRVLVRMEGVRLPHQQRLTENLWGISVLERLYDRMVAYDSASMGAAQLVFKSYLRTLSIDGLRDIVAAGGKPLAGLIAFVETMRQFQGQEGITLLDAKDTFEIQQGAIGAGISDIILQLAQQISGALQIPLVRLLGQSPAGLSASGESDIRTYYDGINQQQEADLGDAVHTMYTLIGRSEGLRLPDDFGTEFRSLWDLDESEKADVADKTVDAVTKAKDAGLFGAHTALKELRQSSRRTGVFTNITEEQINAADDEVLPPLGESMLNEGDDDGTTAGPDGKKKPVAARPRRRVSV